MGDAVWLRWSSWSQLVPVELHCGTVGCCLGTDRGLFFSSFTLPFFFLALWGDLDSLGLGLGPWRYGNITGRFPPPSHRSRGPPCDGVVDLRCLQRKRPKPHWCTFAVHLFCCPIRSAPPFCPPARPLSVLHSLFIVIVTRRMY